MSEQARKLKVVVGEKGKGTAKSPTKAIAREYFAHGKKLRSAFSAGLDALGEAVNGAVGDAYEAALMRISQTDLAAAQAIRAYEEHMMNCVDSLNDALYHECERRAIAPRLARSGTAKTASKGKASKDPKAAAKREALKLWIDRHDGKHPKLRTVEQYAAEVQRRWPILQSSKNICAWSAAWTKAVKRGQNPVC